MRALGQQKGTTQILARQPFSKDGPRASRSPLKFLSGPSATYTRRLDESAIFAMSTGTPQVVGEMAFWDQDQACTEWAAKMAFWKGK